MVYYPSKVNEGLILASSCGDGYTINLKWSTAYPSVNSNKIAYHIYMSTTEDNVFSEGIKFVSIDGYTQVDIFDLTPGQLYHFAVRAVEYNSNVVLPLLLPGTFNSLKIYPQSLLSSNISDTDVIIPLVDTDTFPAHGIVKIGGELINYLSVDSLNNELVLSNFALQRGFMNTIPSIHNTDGYDGYDTLNPFVSYILGKEEMNTRIFPCQSRFEQGTYAFTIDDGYHQVLKDLFTSDMTSTETSNSDFPSYDYSGYHRTDPVLLLTGDCVGSYIGGQQGCIDGYGNINIIRGMSIQDQNTQRQDTLLSLTGRNAVLIKRTRTGITCDCYIPSSEMADSRCPKCFALGTLINTKNGFIPIENIKIGDEILSSDGLFHKVLNTFNHQYIGKLKSITTSTTTTPILCTPEHPILTLGGSHKNINSCGPNSSCKEFIKRGDGKRSKNDIKQLPSGKWHARACARNHGRKTIGTFNTKEDAKEAVNSFLKKHNLPGHVITWKNALELKAKDWLVNKWYKNIKDIDIVEIPKIFQKNTNLGSKRNGKISFKVDEEFLWIIGLYLAEGSSGKREISFSLHKNEINFQNRIILFFKKYGYNSKLYYFNNNDGVNVTVYSTSLSNWFPKWLGHLCNNKKIPNEFMYLPDAKSKALVQGIFDGDFSKRDDDLVQTSEILALQIGEILQRLGQQPNIRRIINNTLTPKGNKRKIAYGVSKELPTFNRKNRRGRWQFNENLLTKIKKIEEVDYNGPVYNLEVEEDHTYVVQNIVVHNCHGTKFVIGYEQFFNPRSSDGRIKIRVGPSDEDVETTEAGWESKMMLDAWTLVIPIIKDRDVLVLFDQNDNEEFRYEVLTSGRNNTIVGEFGGQKLRLQRIRKTDPIYQVRIIRNTSMFPVKLQTTSGSTTNIPAHTHSIVVNEKITTLNQINQTTGISFGHNHQIVNGIVQTVLGHTHTIVLV